MRVKTPPFDNMHILCGRGQQKYNCSGNKVLRQLVASHLQQYMTKSSLRTAKTKIVDTVTTKLFDMGMVFIAMKDGGGGHCWTTLNYADARKKVAHRFRDAARQVISGDQDDHISQQGTTSASLGFDSQDTASAVVSFALDADGLANTVNPPATTTATTTSSLHQQAKQVRSKVPVDVVIDAKHGYVIDVVSSQSTTIGAPFATNVMSLDETLSCSNGLGLLVCSTSTSADWNSSRLLTKRNLLHHELQVLVEHSANGEDIEGHHETLNHLPYQHVHKVGQDDDDNITLSGVDSLEDLEMVFRNTCQGDFWDVNTSVDLFASG
jgi:hypothetical protein